MCVTRDARRTRMNVRLSEGEARVLARREF